MARGSCDQRAYDQRQPFRSIKWFIDRWSVSPYRHEACRYGFLAACATIRDDRNSFSRHQQSGSSKSRAGSNKPKAILAKTWVVTLPAVSHFGGCARIAVDSNHNGWAGARRIERSAVTAHLLSLTESGKERRSVASGLEPPASKGIDSLKCSGMDTTLEIRAKIAVSARGWNCRLSAFRPRFAGAIRRAF